MHGKKSPRTQYSDNYFLDGTNLAAVEKITKLRKMFPQVDEIDMKSAFYMLGESLEDTVNYLKEVYPDSFAAFSEPPIESKHVEKKSPIQTVIVPQQEENYVSLQRISDREYERMKEEMMYQRQLMELCFQTATKMMASRSYQQAKKLSEEGRKHQAIFEDLYLRTFRETFRRANVSGDTLTCIDLHGLRVQEALDILDECLERASANAQMTGVPSAKLEVITGRGVHSVRNIPILKPAVENHLREKGMRFSELEGGFIVNVT